MNRRDFLSAAGAATLTAWLPVSAHAAAARRYENLLILIELKGGNDGLNTIIPYADPLYQSLRPRIAIPRDQVLQLDVASGLHPALQPLLPHTSVPPVLLPGASLLGKRPVPQPRCCTITTGDCWVPGQRASRALGPREDYQLAGKRKRAHR